MQCKWAVWLLIIGLFGASTGVVVAAPGATIDPDGLTCEYLHEPLAVGVENPRLSWRLKLVEGNASDARQSAYQICVASSESLLDQDTPDLWDSGRVESSETLHIAYAGQPLTSGERCYWRVRVWDDAGRTSPWSSITSWRVGLLKPSDWRGGWIGAAEDGELATANQFYRRRFQLPEFCTDGMIYVASLGYHEVYVNGQRLSDAVLAPAISDAGQRVRYVAYDASAALRPGENVIAIALGAGWTLYSGQSWQEAAVKRWPHRPALRVQGHFRDATGDEVAAIETDASWRTQAATIQPYGNWNFGNFGGERQLANDDLAWTQLDFVDSDWHAAEPRPISDAIRLTPQEVEPNLRTATIAAKSIEQTAPDTFHVTLERMFTGFVDANLKGQPGATVVIQVSDLADTPCRYGQHHELVLDAEGRGHFANRFNYACGEWLTIRGEIEPPALTDVQAHLVSTAMARTGSFRCSDPFHNQLYETSLHTLECLNLGGYVVDCAHRERLGYGGDGQVTAMAMLPNYACGAFYTKWLSDWCDVQQPDGNLPFTAPTYGGGGGPAWSGFIVHVTADLYERYADREIVRHNLPAIRRWIDFLQTHTQDDQLQRHAGPEDYVRLEWSFLGDWVYPGHQQATQPHLPMTHFFNNAYYVHTLRRAAELARVIDDQQSAAAWSDSADRVAAATFRKYWNTEQRRYDVDRQANVALAWLAAVAPAEQQPLVRQRLAELVEAKQFHVDTGIGGTLFLLRALQQQQRPDLVFRMASQRDYPSWGHMLDQGATSIWEQWDGGNSRCHSSYLGIGGWYVESLAGIEHDRQAPGYAHFYLRPGIVDGLDWVEGSLESPRGKIESSWRLSGDDVELQLTVPPNTTATLELDGTNYVIDSEDSQALDLGPGTHRVVLNPKSP